jgi:hypothetical protein
MNFVAGCEMCQHLSAEYEAVTLEWFRVQGQLRVAEYSRDEEASNRIIEELSAITARRHGLREAVERHNHEAHPRAAAATGEIQV